MYRFCQVSFIVLNAKSNYVIEFLWGSVINDVWLLSVSKLHIKGQKNNAASYFNNKRHVNRNTYMFSTHPSQNAQLFPIIFNVKISNKTIY